MDHLASFKCEDFDWSLEPQILKQIYKQTNFDSIFYELISNDVIATLSPQLVSEPHNLNHDEELVYASLLAPLERFVCGLDQGASFDELDAILDQIKTLRQPSKMCRRILKTGDVLFSCNDCGFDDTCVVCIDCFHKSAHKDHNYRMSNTDGGGCCDCGDIEAWKQNYACSDHMAADQANVSLSDFEDSNKRAIQKENDRRGILEKISLLPKGVANRFFLVCQASLNYARYMLSWQNYRHLPEIIKRYPMNDINLDKLLSVDPSTTNFFTVLFNDEIHTYDHVINTLVKVIKCPKLTASIMASTVSREGRSLIFRSDYKSCKQVKETIARIPDAGQGALGVEVMHGSVLAHQTFAIKLIEWVKKMALMCDAFRVLTAYTLLGAPEAILEQEELVSDITLLERVMLSNTTYWKQARIDWNDLFVTSMLAEYSIKEKFARLVTRNYPRLMEAFIKDDHDHSVSVLTMTTQLYTVPSLVCMLIEEENALKIISQTLIDVCKLTKRDSPPINYENRHTFDMQNLKRGFYIISDLRHLISIEPTKWTDQLRKNVIDAARVLLNLLSSMQGMDSVKRQQGQHIEYEPEWESGMTLQSRLVTFITRFVNYCNHDQHVLIETLRETQRRLFKSGGFKMVTKELYGHQVSCVQYDVSTSPVSVHLPLTRFAAALILELMRRRPSNRIPYDESLVILTNNQQSEMKYSMIDLMEPALRTEVMIAQFRSGMWRRNGYSLVNQIIYFHGAVMRKEMFDRDILLLQECAAMCDANEFLIHLLNKFNLFTWVTSETTREPLVGPKAVSFYNDEENMTQTMSLGEAFLQLLLTIIGERYCVGVGKIEEEDIIKHEIIQLLCIGPLTRSDLTQKLYVNDHELDCIKKVADLKRSTDTSTGKYELKEEYYKLFNPFFYHYSRRHQSYALDVQLKRKKNRGESLICCPPPPPVELTDQFSNLNELLRSDILLTIVKKILRRAIGPPDDYQECSTKAPIIFTATDCQLDECLHLIGLGLFEQERRPAEFRYIEAAHAKDIFNLLRDCYTIAKRSRDLIMWLVQKTRTLIDSLQQHSTNDETTRTLNSISECLSPLLSICDPLIQDTKKRNSELAAKRRERIMALMKSNQERFLSNPNTKKLVAETEKNEAPAIKAATMKAINLSTNSRDTTSSPPAPAQTSGASTSSAYMLRSGLKTSQTQTQLDPSVAESSFRQVPQRSTQDNIETDADKDADRMEVESIASESGACTLGKDDEDDTGGYVSADEEISQPEVESHLCILCRDEQIIDFNQPTMLLLAYIQRSAFLSKNRYDRRIPNYALTPSNQLKHQFLAQQRPAKGSTTPDMYSFTSDNSWSFDATFMPSDLFFGPYVSSCGHAMHYDCWRGFFDALMKRESSRPNRGTRHVSADLEKNELLCPLCDRISNATIPLLPDYTCFARRRLRYLAKGELSPLGGTIFSADANRIAKSADNLSACLNALRGTVDMFKHIRHIKEVSTGISVSKEDKYMRLLQPRAMNDVLEELGEIEALHLRDFINSIRTDRISSTSCTKDLLSTISTLAERIHTVGLDLDRSITDVHHARIFMMTSWSISYTVQTQERYTRYKGAPLLEYIGSSRSLCLSSLLRFATSSIMIHQPDMIQSLLVRKLRYLFINDEHMSSSPCCLDIDAFETFVSLYISLQKLYAHIKDLSQLQPSSKVSAEQMVTEEEHSFTSSTSSSRGSTNAEADQNYAWATCCYHHEYFRNLLHLLLILNMLQVIISMHNDQLDTEATSAMSSSSDEQSTATSERERESDKKSPRKSSTSGATDSSDVTKEYTTLYNFYREIIIASGHPNPRLPPANELLASRVRSLLLPFMRSCTIFFYHLSHVPPPELLRTRSFMKESEIPMPTATATTTKPKMPQAPLSSDEMCGSSSSPASNDEAAMSLDECPIETTSGKTATQASTCTARDDHEGDGCDGDRNEADDHGYDENDTNEEDPFKRVDLRKSDEEFGAICRYLDLPDNFNQLLRSQEARHLARTWLRHPRVLMLIKSATQSKMTKCQTTTTTTSMKLSSSSSSNRSSTLAGNRYPSQQQQRSTATATTTTMTTRHSSASLKRANSSSSSIYQQQHHHHHYHQPQQPMSHDSLHSSSETVPVPTGAATAVVASPSSPSSTSPSSSPSTSATASLSHLSTSLPSSSSHHLSVVGGCSSSPMSAANTLISMGAPGGSSSPGQQPQMQQQQAGQQSKNELLPVRFIRQPHTVNRLIDLPYDYTELVDKVSDFTCPSIKNEDSRTPTMCLVCGVMLCSQSYCCQRDLNELASNYQQILQRQHEARQQAVTAAAITMAAAATSSSSSSAATTNTSSGALALPSSSSSSSVAAAAAAASAAATISALSSLSSSQLNVLNTAIQQQLVGSCTYHAHECSGGVGIFLRIRNCQILLLSGRSKGCYKPAPYIDDHGETDFGLVRGNPLHLNRQLYERLQHMWMTHAVPEQISRTLEYSSYASNINWHLH